MYPGFSTRLNMEGGDESATLHEAGWLKGFFPRE